MKGKTIVVTGANSGIGKATASGLAKQGHRVVMVCRSREKGEEARNEIRDSGAGGQLELEVCDLASQAEVRGLAARLSESYPSIDVLLNNAAVMPTSRQLSLDGIEMQLAVNHLAPFMLSQLLLDALKRADTARIVTVSSKVHHRGAIDFDDLQFERGYSTMRAYAASKLANVLFTFELARRLKGTTVSANCLHPGVIATNLARDWGVVVSFLWKTFTKNADKGARTSIYLATSSEVEGVSGRYYDDCREARTSTIARDAEVARRLWDRSVELTQLSADEMVPAP
ncbi:MAG: SDR family oxidoreductase [Myxococcales bacterium]|nr:SDR family oxidoreductase [Myxococcales bacterium]